MIFIVFLLISFTIFFLGLSGVFLNRKNILLVLLAVELVLLSINLNFLVTSNYLDELIGQLFAVFVLTIAAAESSIGLAILVVYFRLKNTIVIERINFLKG